MKEGGEEEVTNPSSTENENKSNLHLLNEKGASRKGKSCKGCCLYYSSSLKSNHRNPLCVGFTRSLPKGKPMEILTKLNELVGFAPDEDIELFEEIKFEPNVMCKHVDKKLTFQASQLEDGDITFLQKPLQPGTVKCRYPNVPAFLKYVHNRQVVRFRSLEKPKEDDFSLELSKLNNYDDVVERVAGHLSLDDPSKIRLTSHDCYSQQPKPQPIKYRGVKHLPDILGHYNQGLIHEVFTMILRGLSGTNTTRPGKFRSCQDGYAVKSSLKAEDGVLYPLEKTFFFLPKPPTLILHDEIDYVEFERHAAGGSNMHYFDLVIRLKTEQEHIFRNIQRNEYHNLFDFITSKGLKIMNLGAGLQAADGVAAVLRDEDDDAVDPHLERIRNAAGEESDEEDEDFVADKDDDGSPSDDSGGDDSDGSDSGGEQETIPKKVSKKEATTSKTSSSKKKNTDEGSSKKKKQKRKKDPNAPKGAMSSFMFFSQLERENVKKDIPGIAFSEIGRVLGERWNKLTAEEKAPYEAKAQADKKRYLNQMGDYNKNPSQPAPMELGDESDSN